MPGEPDSKESTIYSAPQTSRGREAADMLDQMAALGATDKQRLRALVVFWTGEVPFLPLDEH